MFTGPAAAALCELRADPVLAGIFEGSNVCSEEIGFSTAAAALGYRVAVKPWNERWVRWRRPVRVHEVAAALADPDCFWVHPVSRSLDEGARTYLRRMSNDYQGFTPTLSPTRRRRRPPNLRLKQRVTDGLFGLLTKPVDGIGAREARAALARARGTES